MQIHLIKLLPTTPIKVEKSNSQECIHAYIKIYRVRYCWINSHLSYLFAKCCSFHYRLPEHCVLQQHWIYFFLFQYCLKLQMGHVSLQGLDNIWYFKRCDLKVEKYILNTNEAFIVIYIQRLYCTFYWKHDHKISHWLFCK